MRENLNPQQLWLIKAGRNTFLFCQVVPQLLYYLRYSDKSPRFPATISWTIRKGPPRWLHCVSWILGWGLTLSGMLPRSNRAIRVYMLQMVLTGIINILFPVDSGGAYEHKIHYWTAAMYLADHYWLFEILNEKAIYRTVFKLCFVGMVIAMILSESIKTGKDLVSDNEDLDGEGYLEINKREERDSFAHRLSKRLSLVCVGGPKALLYPIEKIELPRKKEFNNILRYLNLIIMLTENGIFMSFVLGIASGLQPPKKLLLKK